MEPDTAAEPKVVLRLRGIRKAFGEKVVLDGLDLEVYKSEILVILGRSGGGKSLTLKSLAGLVRPDAGEVTAFKQDVLSLDDRELRRLRRRFGYVFQSGALLNWMTAAENIALPLEESDTGTPEERAARVREVLSLVELPDAGALYPDELSGGMRKRVSLARALAQSPSAILYDEPTTGLDPISTASIDRLIRATRDSTGLTSVVISHDLDSTFRIADRIALLHGGRIRAIAERDEFRKLPDPEVRRFLDAQPE
jgi:phospholipid/cholesterol/gamma-HCH transport system ATP-binding protein